MVPIVSMLARAARGAATSRASGAASAAVDLAGGGSRISACVPRRDLSSDSSLNDLSDAQRGKSTADLPSYVDGPPELVPHLEEVFREMKKKTRFSVSEKEVESDEAIWDLYKRWCNHHKIVRDHGEMKRRFNIFKENARSVQRGERMYGLHMYSDDRRF